MNSVFHFFKNCAFFLVFILRNLINLRFKRFSYSKTKSGKVSVLANGPSLKEFLTNIETDNNFTSSDYVVLNFFANCKEFKIIKPTHYCLADPMFFTKQHRYDEVKSLFHLLQDDVDWDMNIYIPAFLVKKFVNFSKLTNPYLKIVPVNLVQYFGFPKFQNWSYKHNFAIPLVNTVAILAIYIALNQGYDEIHLYGVDHTFFKGLCVNDKNEACVIQDHFYADEPVVTPILRSDNGKVNKMSDHISTIAGIFKAHDILRLYSDYLDVKIYNHTQCSLIDSYERSK